MELQSGDGEHRSAVEFGVVESVQEMDAAGSASCDADTELSGELCIATRHESRGLFVACLDEPDLVLMSAERFDDPVDAVARDAEDGINAPIDESFNEYVGSVHDRGSS